MDGRFKNNYKPEIEMVPAGQTDPKDHLENSKND
jgi:hypothetical protein